jgi:molybdopterin synthase sulfur carrier subunit
VKISVKLFGEFRAVVGADRLDLDLPEGTTCGEALRILAEREPVLGPLLFKEGRLREHLHVFVNGRNVAHLRGEATRLASGDAMTFFPPISGG